MPPGPLLWADDRAVRLLEAVPGQPLRALAARDAEEKVERWELILCVGGMPRAFAFRGAPHEGTVALVGSLEPETMSELARLDRELEESNRGVRALHAELDEKTESLARLLLNPANGVLSPEQHKQVRFIRSSGEALFELVNDLLDLSKMESGEATMRPVRFSASDFMGALRGMMRPLVPADAPVELRFEEPPADLALETDEARLSQVLRNLVFNALKFTEKGHVTVSAGLGPEDTVFFRVSDTGIGIAPEHHAHIFEEFAQVDGPMKKQVKGRGLGLARSRRLAELLGGGITVRSSPGQGATFTLLIPRVRTVDEARRTLQRVLDELKGEPRTRDIPVFLHTSHHLREEERQRLEKETSTIARHMLSREVAITRIRDALHKKGLGTGKNEGRRGRARRRSSVLGPIHRQTDVIPTPTESIPPGRASE